MRPFYIKTLKVLGYGKEDSILSLKPGVNLILGPTGTGKSMIMKCIRFMLCCDTPPQVLLAKGYEWVELTLSMAPYGKDHEILLKRPLSAKGHTPGKKCIEIISSIDGYSGRYTLPIYKAKLLKLLGIEKPHYIYIDKDGDTTLLSARTIFSFFFLHEDTIAQSESPVTHPYCQKKILPSDTKLLSTLLFLLCGKESDVQGKIEKRSEKSAALQAEIQHAKEEYAYYSHQMEENLFMDASLSTEDLEERIRKGRQTLSALTNQMTHMTEAIQRAANHSAHMAHILEEQSISKDNLLALQNLYQQDLERLQFSMIPLTASSIPLWQNGKTEEKHIQEKLHLIAASLLDTERYMEQIKKQKEHSDQYLSHASHILNTDLAQKAEEQENLIYHLEQSIRYQERKAAADRSKNYLKQKEEEQKEKAAFSPWNPMHFWISMKGNGFHQWEALFIQAARQCNPAIQSLSLNPNTMDAIIDHEPKEDISQGQKAFFNVLLIHSLMRYLETYGQFYCPLLLLDSPIMALSEVENGQETIQTRLFNHLFRHAGQSQIIITESKCPDHLDIPEDHIIRFTKDAAHGRYGFLNNTPAPLESY